MRPFAFLIFAASAWFFCVTTISAEGEPSHWSLRAALGYGQFEARTAADPAGLQHLYNPSSDPGLYTLGALAAAESAGPRVEKVTETHARVGLEYLTGKTRIIGLTLGLAYEKAQSRCVERCGDYNTAYSLALAQSGSSATSASTLLYRSVLPAMQQITRPTEYEYGMLDFGINWHPITTEQWDPYVGLKLGLGLCIGDYECNVIKLSPRLGARYNINPNWYLFSELEYQTRVFSNRSVGFDILSGPVIGPAILFGAGWNL